MADLILPRGELKVLQAEDKEYKRGVLMKLLDKGGYKMAYWLNKPDKPYPVEIIVDGKSVAKAGKVVHMKFHPKDYYDKNVEEMLNYPNYLRNQAPVPQNNPDGEHRYYLPKKYKKKNEAILVKEFNCGCHDIYKIERIEEEWSQKYKKSINCSNPKGFSQKAHCQGRKKQENIMNDKLEKTIREIIRNEIKTIRESQMMTEEQFDEAAGKKDACYHKVKARYDVWPSAYASGALVKCRKVGAKNWGNKSKKEGVNENIGKLIGVAVGIAKKMSGNMTGAVKKIEKISKGLSKLEPVQKALRQYNEGFASDAQRRAAFASGYEEKGKKKKKKKNEEALKESPAFQGAIHQAMKQMQKAKVPGKSGKPVSMTTALKDKSQPAHKKAKGVLAKLVDKLKKKEKPKAKKQSKADADFYKKQFTGEAYDIWMEDGSWGYTMTGLLPEAEYQGRKVKLGKPMQGDVKKFKVYVKNPKGNVVKVNFGQGGDAKGGTMRIRKSNPNARKNFRARHNCDSPGPRHKARYWSCRKW